MQTEQEIKDIVNNKIRDTVNKKTLTNMRSAIDKMEKNQQKERNITVLGLLLFLSAGSLIAIYLFF